MAHSFAAKRVTVPSIIDRKKLGGRSNSKKISALTAYDYSTAKILDSAAIDIILVGDSLSSVIQGLDTTIPVTLDEIIYHCKCVARGVSHALLVGDLPFMSYQSSVEKAIESAGRLLKEGAVSAVKLEGGIHMAQTIEQIVKVDIPVMGHVGLTPQSYHRMGGYKIQGRGSKGSLSGVFSPERILEDAVAVAEAGAFAIVLEGLPEDLAGEITNKIPIPTIGIGAGNNCDGQILVINDLLGYDQEACPSFVKCYADLGSIISKAVLEFKSEVESGVFPVAKQLESQEACEKKAKVSIV